MTKTTLKFTLKLILFLFFLLQFNHCGLYKKTDTRETPINAQERARKNVSEGRGVSISGILGNKNTNYEFSTSNPMWRASLEVLDFLPLSTVDYSGGIIITDWYSDNTNSNEFLKITVRFLSNEIQVNSLKIIVHQKLCRGSENCSIKEINSKLKEEIIKSILAKASVLENEQKKK